MPGINLIMCHVRTLLVVREQVDCCPCRAWRPRFESSAGWCFDFFFFLFRCRKKCDHRWLKCRMGNREVSFIYIVLLALLLLLLCVLFLLFFSFCYVDTVCGFTTEYLDLIDYNYYTVRCCTTYEYVFVYTCLLLCSVLLYCCCCSCCWSSSCAGWQNLFPWFTASDSSALLLFIQTRCFLDVPLCSTVVFSASIFLPYK